MRFVRHIAAIVSLGHGRYRGLSLVALSGLLAQLSFGQSYNTGYVTPGLSVLSGAEHVSQTSYTNTNGSVTSAAKHVFSVTFNVGGWAGPNSGDPESNFMNSYANPAGAHPGGNGLLSGTYSGFGVGDATEPTLSVGAIRPGASDLTFYIVNPAELAVSGGTAVSVPIASGGATAPGLSLPVSDSGQVAVNLAAIGSLSGGTITGVLRVHKWWHSLDLIQYVFGDDGDGDGSDTYLTTQYYWTYHDQPAYYIRFDFPVSKLLAQAFSVMTLARR